MKRKVLPVKPAVIILILAMTMGVFGVSYASWSDYLTVKGVFNTGSLNIVFDSNRPYLVQVTDINGEQAGSSINASEISCILSNDKKQASLSFSRSILLEELAGADRFLKFQYPIDLDPDSTVQSVTDYMADLTLPSQEKAAFTLTGSRLVINGSEYMLPEGMTEENHTIFWEVYRQIETQDEGIVATIFLRLSDESLEVLQNPNDPLLDLAQLPEELKPYVMPYGNGAAGLIPAEIKSSYTVSLPLFIEQGRP